MAAAAITDWNRFSFAGNFFWFNWQDTSANRASVFDNLGVLRYDGSAKPALGVFKAMLARPAVHAGTGGGPADGPWLVAANARLYATGAIAAPVAGGATLNRPITGSARTPSGHGVWMVGADGGIFAYGDASFYGSMGAVALNRPIVGMAATPSGHGYWLVASDGGVFSFGDARFYGSTGGLRINRPVVGLARSSSGRGYWMVASDGGIFTFGDAPFYGSAAGSAIGSSVVGIATTTSGHGYWLPESDGQVHSFGDAGIANPVTGTTIVDAITP
jgi:hypothetical protein